MKLTYEEYDKLEEICEQIRRENEKPLFEVDEQKMFSIFLQRPTVAQMEEAHVKENFETFFPYLFFFYTQRLDSKLEDDADDYKEYRAAMDYIRKLMDENIEFADDDGGEGGEEGLVF